MAVLYDSYLNPVKFHKLDNVQLPSYTSRFMDDWAFRRTIQPWEQKTCFYQPWSTHDSVRLQYTSNVGPIIIRLYDQNGYLQGTFPMTEVSQDELRPDYFIRQVSISLSGLEPGKYFFTRDVAGSITYSEPIEILDAEDSGLDSSIDLENPNPTLLLEYSHYEPAGGLKFFTGFAPMIRVLGIIRYSNTESKDNIYEDQLLNQTLINSVPFRVFNFILGSGAGVPPFFVDKIARILSLSNVQIDGRFYTKASENSAFELAVIEDYPMMAPSIELREKFNRDSVIIDEDIVVDGIHAAALLIDNKGFGIFDNGTNYQQIIHLL